MKNNEIKNQMTDGGDQRTENGSQKAADGVKMQGMLEWLCNEMLQVRMGAGHLSRARQPDVEKVEPANDSEAARVFALVVKMDAHGKQKAPTPLTVFRHYCMEGLSAHQVAAKCRCGKGTVMRRLRQIEQATNTRPKHFRAMSGHLLQMVQDYQTSGAREIYRRGLISED